MIERILRERLTGLPKSLLLLGPRQVGKSTLCRSLEPDIAINLASEKTFSEHLRDPGLLERIVAGRPQSEVVWIDEVQRIPSMLNTVQAIIDEQRRRFLLTGSSARKLRRGRANLLPGRVFVEHLPPLVYEEIRAGFDLDRALMCGTLPEVYLHDYGPDLLESYAATYLREEVQAEALTKDLAAYSRFLDLAAELSGHYINYSKIATGAETPKQTIRRYIDILEDTLLIERVPSFTRVDKRRKARQREKFIFFDLGVRNAILRRHRSVPSREERGHLFEQWIILQVVYITRLLHRNWRISTYRDDGGIEVDLIIEQDRRVVLVEIKNTTRVDEKMFKNLSRFEDVSELKGEQIVVYQGEHVQHFAPNRRAVPYGTFLSNVIYQDSA